MNRFLATPPAEFTATDTWATIFVGILIVFSILAIIWLCLVIMERIFSVKKQDDKVFLSPFEGKLLSITAGSRVAAGDVVMIVADSSGAQNEIYSPQSGKLVIELEPGASFKKGDTLFSID